MKRKLLFIIILVGVFNLLKPSENFQQEIELYLAQSCKEIIDIQQEAIENMLDIQKENYDMHNQLLEMAEVDEHLIFKSGIPIESYIWTFSRGLDMHTEMLVLLYKELAYDLQLGVQDRILKRTQNR